MNLSNSFQVLYLLILVIISIGITVEIFQYLKRWRKKNFEKTRRKRIAILNYENLWEEFRRTELLGVLPEEYAFEWNDLRKRYESADKNYKKSEVESVFPSLEVALIQLTEMREFEKEKAISFYNYAWRELLTRIEEMNFPDIDTEEWKELSEYYLVGDLFYEEMTGECGELQNTLWRMMWF